MGDPALKCLDEERDLQRNQEDTFEAGGKPNGVLWAKTATGSDQIKIWLVQI